MHMGQGWRRRKAAGVRGCLALAFRAAVGLACGSATYLAAYRLAAPIPSAMAGGLGVASGLAWAASAVAPPHDEASRRLGLAAAVLATLAATCLLP